MGSLSDVTLPTEEVSVSKGQTITVRGLSLTDVALIYRRHAEALENLYQEHIVDSDELPPMDKLARVLFDTAPNAVAEIIAAANDEPEMAPEAARLPGLVQIRALITVMALTFESEEEVKNLMETLIQGSSTLSRLLSVAGNRSLPAV